jgi:hypothetical protein
VSKFYAFFVTSTVRHTAVRQEQTCINPAPRTKIVMSKKGAIDGSVVTSTIPLELTTMSNVFNCRIWPRESLSCTLVIILTCMPCVLSRSSSKSSIWRVSYRSVGFYQDHQDIVPKGTPPASLCVRQFRASELSGRAWSQNYRTPFSAA